MWGKVTKKTLVDVTLRGFLVPGAGDESMCLKKILKSELVCVIY